MIACAQPNSSHAAIPHDWRYIMGGLQENDRRCPTGSGAGLKTCPEMSAVSSSGTGKSQRVLEGRSPWASSEYVFGRVSLRCVVRARHTRRVAAAGGTFLKNHQFRMQIVRE